MKEYNKEYTHVITVLQKKSYRMEFKSLSPYFNERDMAMKLVDSIKKGNNNSLIKEEIVWNYYCDEQQSSALEILHDSH